MKPSILFLLALGTAAQASWFGSDTSTAATAQITDWSWDKYAKAQQAFTNLHESAFDHWDESRIREFLLEQGVVQPKGTREQLALLAKQKYRSYQSAASSWASQASKSATSAATQASKSASTAVYGDSKYQASKSLSSYYAQAPADVSRKLDDSKDYVYST